ncbi:MAG: benzylsuccinate synthase gamma subunit family protein [Desulfobacterales bacterium]
MPGNANVFPRRRDPAHGDCVQRVVDPRQAYYMAKSVNAEDDAGACDSFQKKGTIIKY